MVLDWHALFRLQSDVGYTPALPINFAELRLSKRSAFEALAEGPTSEERMIMTSTMCSDISRIRAVMKDYGGDVDLTIEALIAAADDADDADTTAAAAAPAPAPVAMPAGTAAVAAAPPMTAAQPLPPARPVGFWICPVCTYKNGAARTEVAPEMCICRYRLLFIVPLCCSCCRYSL